jgi:hypothetical protein
MATVKIKLSQNVIDQQQSSESSASLLDGSVGGLVDAIALANNDANGIFSNFSSWSLVGSTLRINYTGAVTETYTGVVLDNPNADHGSASASGYALTVPGLLTLTAAGTLNYDYSLSGANPSLTESARGSTLTSFGIATTLATNSPDYDPLLGNVSLALNGSMKLLPTGGMSGTINKITASADKFLLSGTIDGNFQLSANLLTAGQGLTHSVVEGVLTGYNETYRDGSQVSITGISANMNAGQPVGMDMLAAGYYFSGNDEISVELPGHLYSDFVVAAGDGNDRITINGGGGRLNVSAGAGNDQITILGDAHNVYGSLGIDTAIFTSARSDYVLQKLPSSSPDPRNQGIFYSVTDKSGAVNSLADVERIKFADKTFALDIDGNAGQAYRLYQAAFNRTPDSVGLGFWINALDGGTTLISVAQGFVNSAEFKDAYGANLSSRDLVTKFYTNILHRAPEAGGLDFWTGVLDSKAAGVADVLGAISESAENKAGLIGVIGNGFEFTPYGHV